MRRGQPATRATGACLHRWQLLVAGCCTLGAIAPELGAQDTTTHARVAPYSTVTVALSGVRPASSGRLEDYWTAGNGLRFDIHMPFHVGEAGITATTLRHEALGTEQPGFRAIIIGANWRFPLGNSRRVRPAIAVEAGNFMTIFDGEQPKGLGKESEIYVGGEASVRIAVLGGTSVLLGADARHVFTSTPVRLTSLHAGLAQTMSTPRWLRAVIE